ncbi:MAG: hypothetical protein ABSC95_12520, partial [Acetobacteraceae bacterium]
MTSSTWTWIGATSDTTLSSNWSLTAGPGNIAGLPQSGDTRIIGSATAVPVLFDAFLSSATVDLVGNGVLEFSNLTTAASSSGIDSLSVINAGTATTLALAGPFDDAGTIAVTGTHDTLAISLAAGVGAPATLSGVGSIIVGQSDTLTITGGTLFGIPTLAFAGNFAVNGVAEVAVLLAGLNNFAVGTGGTLELSQAGTAALTDITFTGTSGLLKLDTPASFAGNIDINDFALGDTIDLGPVNVSTVVFDGNSDIFAIGSSGTVFSASTGASDSALDGFDNPGTFVLSGTGGLAGNLRVTEGGGGDTLLTVLAPSTWKWTTGASASFGTPADWTVVSGPGNGWGYPSGGGDSAIDAGGSIFFGNEDFQTSNNTIDLGGTAGVAALFTVSDTGTSAQYPSLNGTSLLTNVVPGNTTAETSLLSAAGIFVNEGTILADGPTGSSFTIAISGTTINGAFQPGYFTNYGTIMVDAGNAMTIDVAGTSEFFNPGTIIANGGSLFIDTATNAIGGGYAPDLGLVEIGGGGTVETTGTYAFSEGGTSPSYAFLDGTPGDTLKIDDVKQNGARLANFQAGDTVDLGAHFAVSQLVYDASAADLYFENAGGTVLASLIMGGFQTGTYAVNPITGAAGDFVVSTGTDGDTLLTTTVSVDSWDNVSGSWQNPSLWSGGVPGPLTIAAIGLGSTGTFTVTTGSVAATANSLGLWDPNALLQITSATSIAPNSIQIAGGTLEVTTGNTLTGTAIRMFSPAASLVVDQSAVLDLAGHLNDFYANDGSIEVQNGNSWAAVFNGNVLVNGGTIDGGPGSGQDGGFFQIGADGQGTPATVTVENGGVVSDTYSYLSSDPTSFGVLTLSGSGTSWDDEIDPNDALNSRGYMIVGNNNQAGNTPAGVAQPPYAGTAQLTVENGATLTDARAIIADSGDSAGAATVSTGGQWNIGLAAGGYLAIADGGQASLSVVNGGTVSVGNVGTFLSNGTTITGGGIGVGYNGGNVGVITVSGAGSELLTQDGMALGKGGQGILTIVNGGTVAVSSGGITVGQSAGARSSGTLSVGGPGSAAALNFGTAAGGLTVGGSTQGTLIVSDNGTVNLNGTGYLTIGSGAGSAGDVVVGGAATSAVINIGTAGLTVGNSGTGTLTVNSLGTVALTGPGGITVGQNFGAAGTMTVNGGLVTEGSTTGGVYVGENSGAAASVTITNDGTVSLAGGGLFVGQFAGANGGVTVQGSGSALDTSGSAAITVGSSGSGTLTVSAAGSVNDASFLSVGALQGGNGSVLISGGTLTTPYFVVGSFGDGTLGIANGGKVFLTSSVPSEIGVWSGAQGTVTVTGAGSLLQGENVLAGASGHAVLNVQNGGSVSLTSLGLGGNAAPTGGTATASVTGGAKIETGSLYVWQSSTVSVDSATGSGIDVGTSGSFVSGAIEVENGYSIVGNGLIAAAVLNDGVIEAVSTTAPNTYNPATMLEIQGSITGTGTLLLGPTGIMKLDDALPASQSVVFQSGGELILNAPGTAFANAITGFSAGDKIEFGNGMTIDSASVVNFNPSTNTGTIVVDFNGSGGLSGTYDLTNVTFAAGSSQQLSWGYDGTTGDANIQVQPTYLNWTGDAGDELFGDANNWSPQQSPGGNTSVDFSNNPGTVTGTGSALSINIGNYENTNNNSGTWTFNNATITAVGQPNAPYLPFAVGFYVNTVLNGGTLNAAGGSVGIGNILGATVTAQDGATVTTDGDGIGTGPGQYGALVVTGSSTSWTEETGSPVNGSNPGYLSIASAGAFNGQPGSAGSLTVTQGALLTTGGGASIGYNTGAVGSATVSAGGRWLINGTNGLSAGFSGIGTLNVTDALVSDTGFTGLGQGTGGQGYANVTSGGTLDSGNGMQIGGNGLGTLMVSGGTVSTVGFTGIGQGTGGEGSVSVSGGGVFNSTGGLNVGGQGSGTLVVNGGSVTDASYLNLGGNSGGSGTLTLSNGTLAETGFASIAQGTDSTGVATVGTGGVMTSNGLNVGGAGFGVLAVNGGTVTSASGSVAIAAGIGSDGSVSVGGGGHFDNTGLTVGGSGLGALAVNNGEITDSSFLTIGNLSGAVGIANVTGATVSVAANTVIGNSGDGTLTLGSGGTILANGTYDAVGNNTGSNGALIVDAGGRFQASATTVAVGLSAGSSGELIVNAGGTVISTLAPQTTTLALTIGNNAATSSQRAAEGSVLVTGAGALLNSNNNAVAVGNLGLGSLTVAQGGTVDVGSANSSLIYSLGIANDGGTGAVTVTGAGSSLTANGYLLDGRGGSGSLTVENDGVVVVNDAALTGSGIGIGAGRSAGPNGADNFGGNGVAVITSGGTLDLNSTVSGMTVGGNGVSGALTVNHSGMVLAGTGLTVGTATSASGTIYGGNGQLNIGTGGTVEVNNPLLTGYDVTIGSANSDIGGPTTTASGQALVSGAGALLNANGAGVAVGWLSSGELTVSQGGSVVSGTPDSSTFSALAIGRQASGAVTVTDPGSSFTANGNIYVGRAGAGSLTIENQGSMNVGLDGQGNGGVEIGGSGFTSGNTLFVGGSGTALVNSDGDLFSTDSVTVGENGADGALTVNTGGTVETGHKIIVGNAVGLYAGDTLINAAGSATVLTTFTQVTGNGVINVGPGGIVESDGPHVQGSPSVILGAGSGSSGTVNVTGSGVQENFAAGVAIGGAATVDPALLSTGGDGLSVGENGEGQMVVSQAGTVLAGTQFATDSAVYVGQNYGSSGYLEVTDLESTLIATGRLVVGAAGSGSMLVQNQATVTTGNSTVDPTQGVVIGQSSDGVGNLTVTGFNSLLSNTGQFLVGDAGLGSLTIANSAMVVTNPGTAALPAAAVIGNQTGSDGSSITVNGFLSEWDVGGTLVVGNAAAGSLSITNGGTVSASQVVAGAQSSGIGSILLSGDGSELQATSLDVGTVGAGIVTIGSLAVVDVTNPATFGAQGRLNMQGGTLDPTQVLFTSGLNGGTGVIAATLEIDNAATLYAAAGTLTLNAPIVHTGSLGGAGLLQIDTGGDLAINGAVDVSQTVDFAGTGTLTIGDIHQFAPTDIAGFAPGDTIVVDGVASLGQSFDSATDQLVLTDQVGNHYTLQFTGALTAGDFTDAVVPGSLSATGAWASDISGDFDDPGKWVGGAVPGASMDAVIDFTDQPQVTHDTGSDTVHSVRNLAGDFVMSGGTLTANTLENDSSMAWTGGSLVLNSGTGGVAALLNTAGASLAIAPNGQRLTATGTGTASVSNAGTITVDGALGEA